MNDEVGSPRPVCLVCFASVAAAGLGSPCRVYVRVILPHVHSLSCRSFSLADRASGQPSLPSALCALVVSGLFLLADEGRNQRDRNSDAQSQRLAGEGLDAGR